MARTIAAGPAGTELIASSRDLGLLVVGAQLHTGNLNETRVGAVASTVLHHHAACPVAVVPLA